MYILKKIKNFFIKIKNFFYKIYYSKHLDNAHYEWENFQLQTILEIKKKGFKKLLTLKTIKSTMFKEFDEFTEIQQDHLNKKFFKKYPKNIFKEVIFTKERDDYSKSILDSNTIHHCFHLAKYEEITGNDISKFKNIIEFGGGYGNLIRIIKKINLKCNYLCYDLDFFNKIQTRFLMSHGFSINKNYDERQNGQIILSNNKELFKRKYEKSLFISTWGISEVEIENRELFINFVTKNDMNALIASQNIFENINNIDFFKKKFPNFLMQNLELRNSKNFYIFK